MMRQRYDGAEMKFVTEVRPAPARALAKRPCSPPSLAGEMAYRQRPR